MRLPYPDASRPFRLLVLLVVLFAASLASGADFRIVSEVYLDGEKEPFSTNRTLFRAGVVYDYLEAPGMTTVFDPARQRFLLLDPETKLRCEVATPKIAEFNGALRQRALKHADPLLRFMAQPAFTIDPSPGPQRLVMTSPLVSYRLKTTPVEEDALRQYIEFSDWYAQLNTMVNVGSPPPFPRIEVNRELNKRGWMPLEVQLLISVRQSRGGNRDVKLLSRHDVMWRLLGEDLQAIERTADEMATYEQVTFEVFQQRGNALAGAPPAPNADAQDAPLPAEGVRRASATEPARNIAGPKRR
ncbi:MAG: hypothetical protein AB7U73_15230 [Pirellulales bacterium]